MVVVDSSALIPLARVGRLGLIDAAFEAVQTPEPVAEEVLVDGQPGTAALDSFFDGVSVVEMPSRAEEVAQLEGIARADAAVVLCAADADARLLANDKALVDVARTHGVECWWVTTLLLHCTAADILSAAEATDVLYELVDEGMNLDPTVYARVQRELEKRANRNG
jgi:predicted nucleic acid-binding protein